MTIVKEQYTWDKISSWDLVLPPSRPSRYHLWIILNQLKYRNKELPVAILGSTPEYRDLLHRLGYVNVFVFEKSEPVFNQMSNLTSFQCNETLVRGDWLQTLAVFSNRFDIILSDLTSGNVPYDLQAKFYAAISNSLLTSGLFIDKILTFQRPKLKLKKLIRKYSQLPVNLLYINYFSCEFLFCSELLDIDQRVDSTYFYNYLADTFDSPILNKFLTESPKITPYDTVWFYGREWNEIIPFYTTQLQTVHVYDDERSSPYHGFLKVIIGRKN